MSQLYPNQDQTLRMDIGTQDLADKLEELWNAQMATRGEPTKAQALYDKILSSISLSILSNKSYDSGHRLVVYSIQAESGLLPDQDADQIERDKNLNRISYIRSNKEYLEWYFTTQFGVPNLKFVIEIDTVHVNTLLNKKTKTILNIVLQRR